MRLVLEETIAAPVNIVFSAFTDLGRAAERVTSITKVDVLGKGPIGKGTRFRETRVVFGKKESTQELEITDFDAPRSFTLEANALGTSYHTVYRFEGGQRETQMTMTTTSRPLGLVGKITGPLMGWMMASAMKKSMLADHADLKRYCEAQQSAQAPE